VHSVFGHKEWNISVEWKNFSTEDLQILFFMLGGVIKSRMMRWTNQICVQEVMKNMKLSFAIGT
jgi:hypothetical protein